jgi:homoserine dehydrogenase
VQGDVVGTTLYIGRGAGQDATSSAVISDIADAVALLKNDRRAFVTARKDVAVAREASSCKLAPPERIHGRYYLRITVKDRPGVLARVATVMAEHDVSIASLTHDSNERAIHATIARLRKLPVVLEAPLLLRIGEFGE